jgi:hypothetical protein
MARDGQCVWIDPYGRQYAGHPINHHDLVRLTRPRRPPVRHPVVNDHGLAA